MKFLIFLLFAFPVIAQECKPMNLITEKDSPFKDQLPVYDQDGMGICYAYSAAQILNYQLIKRREHERVHPLWALHNSLNNQDAGNVHEVWAAYQYADAQKDPFLGGGGVLRTLKATRGENCQSGVVSETLKEYSKKADMSEIELVALIENYATKLKSVRDLKQKTDPAATLLPTEVADVVKSTIDDRKKTCKCNPKWDELSQFLESLASVSSTEMFANLLLPACRNSKPIKRIGKPGGIILYKEAEAASVIDKKLDDVASPVAIAYCANVLRNPAYAGVVRSEKQIKLGEGCSGHASILVGKKKIGESCHFLLRNTWGPGFSNSTKPWKCLCKNKTDGSYVDDCTNETHNNGNFTVEGCWIPGDAIAKNTVDIAYLTKRKPFFKRLLGK